MDPRIRQTIDFMKQSLSSRLTERELAGQAGVSPQHLCALFKSETGETPMRYLNQLRMDAAREMLADDENSHLSIKEIGVRVGCRDQSHFVRDFQQRFGASPRRYRAKNQAG
jgi:AraC family transcriptional regulator